MPTTIALSEETHDGLARFKKAAHLRSMDEAVAQLLRGGEHTIERLLAPRRVGVENVCKQWKIRRLTAFGSRVWGAPHASSDVDLVAEFGIPVSLFQLLEAQEDLAAAFGANVDLHTWKSLRPRLAKLVRERGVAILG